MRCPRGILISSLHGTLQFLAREEGTVWWHAHSDWTRASVHGAIVILPAVGTTFPFPKLDEDEVIVIASWYKGDLQARIDEAMENDENLPHSDAYTINGQPGDLCPCSNEANQVLGSYYMAARHFSSENVAVGDFDHANVTAILEYNGNYTHLTSPVFPSSLPMYYNFAAYQNFANRIRSLATPEYAVHVPLDNEITTRMFITTSMNSLCCEDSSSGCETKQISASVNNISWDNPSTHILQTYYRNISGVYSADFPDYPPSFYNFTEESYSIDTVLTVQGRKVKVLNYNESVEIVFQGTNVLDGSVNHPMHLHGYSFYVVGYGFGIYDNATDPKGFNLIDPPEVTTFGVPKNGWLAIRFTANNSGVWFWHCYMDRHLTWGMEAAFIVKNGDTNETSIRKPPTDMPLCTIPLHSGLKDFPEIITTKKGDYL
ncbi:hypothetical protein ACLB2K_046087 [Fragaria x ananassa]